MELERVIRERYAVRDFKPDPVEDDKLNAILEAGRLAPTAKNGQLQRIYVFKSPEALEKLRALTPCAFNAPVVLMSAYDMQNVWQNPFEAEVDSGREDASIVGTHMMLRACDLGLGSCWVAHFPPMETARAFGLPENIRPVMLLPIGYPSDNARPTAAHSHRPPLDKIVTTL